MIDLRGELAPVRDQGRRGTCVAFAASAGHELLRADGEDLAEEFLYWASKARDGLTGDGTTLAAASAALADEGQAVEECWPYDPDRDAGASDYAPSAAAMADAALRRLPQGPWLAPSYVDIRDALTAGGTTALVLGIEIHEGWRDVDASGEIQPQAGPGLGGHAVLVAGVRVVGGVESLIVRNSWGDDWGEGGYAYLAQEDVDNRGLAAWVLGTR